MSDIETINPDQLAVVADPPEDAHLLFHSPGGPLARIPHDRLLAKLIGTGLAKTTKAALDADLAHDANTVALVHGDAVALANGWYRKTGASGAGAWLQFEVLSMAVKAAIDAAATTVDGAAALIAGAPNYRATFAEALADFAPGEYFACKEATLANPDGETRTYQRVVELPGYVDQGDKAAPLTRSTGLLQSSASIYTVSDGADLPAAVARATADGGGIVRFRRGATLTSMAELQPGAGVIIDLNGGTLVAGAAVRNVVRFFGNGAGVENGLINGAGLIPHTNAVIDGNGYSGFLEQIDLIGWKRGVRFNAIAQDISFRAHGLAIHSPAPTLAIAPDPKNNIVGDKLQYPIQIGGGGDYREVMLDVDTLSVTGVGGNYQAHTGTPDQIAFQNCIGRARAIKSTGGGENGGVFARLSHDLDADDIQSWDNNGNGWLWGSALVELIVDSSAGMLIDTDYTGSVSGAVGKVLYISGTRVILNFVAGQSLLFVPGETISKAGGGSTPEVKIVRFCEAFRIGTVKAWNNSTDAPGTNSGIALMYVRGRQTSWYGAQSAWDDRAVKLQAYGLNVSQCDGVDVPLNATLTGNLTGEQVWSVSPGYRVAGQREWRKSLVTVPALQPGDSVQIDFTGMTGVLGGQFIQTSLVAAALDGLTRHTTAPVNGTIRVILTNATTAATPEVANALFNFAGRNRAAALSVTDGAVATVGAVIRGGAMQSVLAADFTVTNSTALANSGLAVAVKAGRKYAFRAQLWVSSAVTPGFKVAAALSAAGTGGVVATRAAGGVAETDLGVAIVGTGGAVRRLMEISGFCLPTADGELRVQFAQNTADAGDTKLLAPSRLELFA